MPLYGHEMDETVNPFAAGLGWAVKLEKGDFVGRDALRKFKAEPRPGPVGLALGGKRIARQGAAVSSTAEPVGVVTSGTFSPTLGRALAMALGRALEPPKLDTPLTIDVRGPRPKPPASSSSRSTDEPASPA